jgi:hypothetical protein
MGPMSGIIATIQEMQLW